MNRARPALLLVLGTLCAPQQACQRAPDQQRIAETARLSARVDSFRRSMDDLDTVALRHLVDLFAAQQDRLAPRFADTLDVRSATVLGNYHRALAQVLPHALHDRAAVGPKLEAARLRLVDLDHDLQHDLLDPEEIARILARETEAVDGLAKELNAIDRRIASARRDHERFRAGADSLLNTPAP